MTITNCVLFRLFSFFSPLQLENGTMENGHEKQNGHDTEKLNGDVEHTEVS